MFNFDYLINALPIMGKGMPGVFAVTAVIVALVALLNKITGDI